MTATTNDEVGLRFLLIAGKPIEEPVVQYGPFVMNTQVSDRAHHLMHAVNITTVVHSSEHPGDVQAVPGLCRLSQVCLTVTSVPSCICAAVQTTCHAHSDQDCDQRSLSPGVHTAYRAKYRPVAMHI